MEIVQDIISNITQALELTFLNRDVLLAVIAVVIAFTFGFLMKTFEFGKAIFQTVYALFAFALVVAIINLFRGGRTDLSGWLTSNIDAFLSLTLRDLLVSFIAFFIVITIAHFIRSAFDK